MVGPEELKELCQPKPFYDRGPSEEGALRGASSGGFCVGLLWEDDLTCKRLGRNPPLGVEEIDGAGVGSCILCQSFTLQPPAVTQTLGILPRAGGGWDRSQGSACLRGAADCFPLLSFRTSILKRFERTKKAKTLVRLKPTDFILETDSLPLLWTSKDCLASASVFGWFGFSVEVSRA